MKEEEEGSLGQTTQATPPPTGSSWRRLLIVGSVAVAVAIAGLLVVIGELIPPLIVIAVLLLVGAALARHGKAGVIIAGVAALFFIVSSAPFVVETVTFPASTTDFVINLVSLAGALVILVAAIAILRSKGHEAPSPAAKTFGTITLAVVVAGTLFSVGARLTREDPLGHQGDLDVRAEDTEFAPTKLEASGSEVAIFIENKDLTAHTFTIDELEVDEGIPGGGSARVVASAEAGTYEYYCAVTGHEDMKGTLTVGTTF